MYQPQCYQHLLVRCQGHVPVRAVHDVIPDRFNQSMHSWLIQPEPLPEKIIPMLRGSTR